MLFFPQSTTLFKNASLSISEPSSFILFDFVIQIKILLFAINKNSLCTQKNSYLRNLKEFGVYVLKRLNALIKWTLLPSVIYGIQSFTLIDG
jgi:hypothetical protein